VILRIIFIIVFGVVTLGAALISLLDGFKQERDFKNYLREMALNPEAIKKAEPKSPKQSKETHRKRRRS
jgi:Sec-independent protein translocase protein TatA